MEICYLLLGRVLTKMEVKVGRACLYSISMWKEKKEKGKKKVVQYNSWKGGRSHPNLSEDCPSPMEASLLLVGFLDS